MKDGLPQGWSAAALGSLGRYINGRAFKAAEWEESGLPIIRIQNLNDPAASFNFSSRAHDERFRVRKGDLLIAWSASLGAFIWDGEDAWLNQHIFRVEPETRLCTKNFLLHAVRHAINELYDKAHGTGIVHVTKPVFEAHEIPLPPLREQRRIGTKLEMLLGKVDASQQRLAKVPILLKRFRQSVLAGACSGRLTADWREHNPEVRAATDALAELRAHTSNQKVRRGVPENVPISESVAGWEMPATWAFASAAELLRLGAFIDLKDGNHGANHPKVSDFTENGLPFITAAQVNDFRINYESAYKIAGKPLSRLRVGFAKPGDVIYTHKGSVGRVAVADRECILTPQTTYYRVSEEFFVNRYVMLFLASQPFTEQVDVVKEQTTRDFVPISEQYLFFHRIPPFREQQEIVRRVEGLFALADQLEERLAKAREQLNKLAPSLLARAFAGQLVPQDPNDEPASVLLERIRSTRSSEKLVNRQRQTVAPAENKPRSPWPRRSDRRKA